MLQPKLALIIYAVYFTDNVFQLLADGLGKIKVIDGSLTISRSFPIVSLDFFEDLEEIRGIHTVDVGTKRKNYALELTENENLQVLFPDASERANRKNVTISSHKGEDGDKEQGSAFIHYNPKLCRKEITNLLEYSGMRDPDKTDISYGTNGDKAICSTNKLNLTFEIHLWDGLDSWMEGQDTVDLWFTNYQKYLFEKGVDTRQLLKYEINYIEISDETYARKNLTKYQGRDACGGSEWITYDKKPSSSGSVTTWVEEQSFIRPLKPFTCYAVYVTTMIGKTNKFNHIHLM